jgi:hypothetical protein
MRRTAIVLVMVAVAGCAMLRSKPKAPKEVADHFRSQALYTCCNIHYQGGEITDANYTSGPFLPVGTPVQVKEVWADGITFSAKGQEITLRHVYGVGQEGMQQYFDKVLVASDRSVQVANFPGIIRKAIDEGRVEKGMTRGEVVLSIGFPPTDDNPVPGAPEWKYWYEKGKSFLVKFDSNGYVSAIEGRPAPTSDKPVRVYESELQ